MQHQAILSTVLFCSPSRSNNVCPFKGTYNVPGPMLPTLSPQCSPQRQSHEHSGHCRDLGLSNTWLMGVSFQSLICIKIRLQVFI